MDDYLVTVLSNIGMISFVALSCYLLLIMGEISFGQQAFFAISAYVSAMATTMWGWPLWVGLLLGACIAALTSALLGFMTHHLHKMYFSIATLAFAEMIRLSLLIVTYQIEINGEMVGPDGAEGFQSIRWVFENNVTPLQYMGIVWGLLIAVLCFFLYLENSRFGSIIRMMGEDGLLAQMQGLNVVRYRIITTTLAGFIAGVGGGLYAHFATYVEPQMFNVMLGVHAMAYGLIGGLGTALGPLIGVILDIGFLESVRAIQGYRMIAFGGLVAVLIIFMPRGILHEGIVHRFRLNWRRRLHAKH